MYPSDLLPSMFHTNIPQIFGTFVLTAAPNSNRTRDEKFV
jgi:hypothetical protein